MKIAIIGGIIALIVVAAAGFWVFGKKYFGLKYSPSPSSIELLGTASPTPTTTSATPTRSPSPRPSRSPSPTPTPTPLTISITLNSSGVSDGFESSNGGGNTGLDIKAGRNSNLISRGFVSFDIPASLIGKTIEKATLRLYQGKVTGVPYSVGVSVKVDHLDYGTSLENGDYYISSLSSSFGTLTSSEVIEWKDVEVTDRIRDDLANSRPRSQYRIHFATETIGGDVIGDFAHFESQDNSIGTGNVPQLVIKYH